MRSDDGCHSGWFMTISSRLYDRARGARYEPACGRHKRPEGRHNYNGSRHQSAGGSLPREAMQYDVVIVGGGPSGLAAAIRLKQLAAGSGREVGVCVLEKGSEIGAHILSGAVIDPRALNELIPDWQARGAPLDTPVTEDRFLVLTGDQAYRIPTWMLPPLMNNHGNYIASLGNLCRWLGREAEALGVEIYPGFPAAEVLYDERGAVRGVATGEQGVARDDTHKPEYQPGMELTAKYTLFAEGCRGSLSQELMARFNLRDGVDPQKYGIGLKELWQVAPGKHRRGLVIHTQGWPLDAHTALSVRCHISEDRKKYGIGLKELWQVAPGKHRRGLVIHTQGWPLDAHTGGGSFVYHFGQ